MSAMLKWNPLNLSTGDSCPGTPVSLFLILRLIPGLMKILGKYMMDQEKECSSFPLSLNIYVALDKPLISPFFSLLNGEYNPCYLSFSQEFYED